MSKKINQIDEFYRDALGSNTQAASAYAWTRMRWRLFWLNYNGYILGISAAAIVALAILFGPGLFNVNKNISPGTEPLTGNSSNVVINKAETAALPENEETENKPGVLIDLNDESKETKETDLVVPLKNINQKEQNSGLQISSEQMVSINLVDDFFTEEEHELIELSSIKSLGLNEEIGESNEPAVFDTDFETFKTPYDIELKKHWVSIGLSVVPAYTTSSLKANDEYEEYLQYRNDHESPAISVSAGLDVRFNIRKWYIQTGLGFTEFKQNRNYNNSFKALDSLKSYYQTDTIWGWVFDPPNVGDQIVLGYDTTFIPVYNQTNEGYNRWTYLEVPLIAGYKFKTGRFSLDVGAGFSCAFLITAEGNVPHLAEENRFTDIANLEDEMNKYLFSYILQLGASYYITPEWSINFSPFYKQNLNSVFNNNYPVDQKFRSIGINFGLKVDL